MNTDIKDVQPPVALPLTPPAIKEVLPWLAIIICVVIVVLLVIYFLKHRKAKPLPPPLPAWEIAHAQLRQLLARNLVQQGQYKLYYVELSDILRRYIEARFAIHAPNMSTEEFLNSLRNSIQLSDAHKVLLREFLNLCDMVKFAKYGPTPQEAVKSFDLVKQFVEATRTVETQ